MASRKGIEPLTPGLGNLCSILLSYRDKPRRAAGAIRAWTSGLEAGKATSMDFRLRAPPSRKFQRLTPALRGLVLGAACLAFALAARALPTCGAPSGIGRVAGVDERLDIALADGRLVRLAGLDLSRIRRGAARTAEAARRISGRPCSAGRDVELRLLASGTDRWGRRLADLAIVAHGSAGARIPSRRRCLPPDMPA